MTTEQHTAAIQRLRDVVDRGGYALMAGVPHCVVGVDDLTVVIDALDAATERLQMCLIDQVQAMGQEMDAAAQRGQTAAADGGDDGR